MKNISIKEIFKKSWRDFKQNWLVLVGSMVIFIILSFILGGGKSYDMEHEVVLTPAQTVLGFIGFFVSIYFGITFTRTYLKITDGQKVKFLDFFTNIKGVGHFFKYLGTVILAGIVMVVPILVVVFLGGFFAKSIINNAETFFPLIVTAIILFFVYIFSVMIFLMFTANFSAENRYHFFKAIKKSFAIGKKNFGKIILLILATFVINIVGALALGIGLLVTFPVTYLMFYHFYRVADPEVEIVEVENENEDIKIA